MNVAQLFDKIAGKYQVRRQQRFDTYRELVAMIARGQEPETSRIKQVDSLRGQVKAIEKAQTELAKRRDQLEQRMREW